MTIRMTSNDSGLTSGLTYLLSDQDEANFISRGTAVKIYDGSYPAMIATDANNNTVLEAADGAKYAVHSAAYDEAVAQLRQVDYGTQVTNLANAVIIANNAPISGPTGVVSTDRAPVKTPTAVRLIGGYPVCSITSQFVAAQSTGAGFTGFAFWAKVKGRTIGPMMCQIFLGNGTDPYTGKSIALTVGVQADGKWHLTFVPRQYLAAQNGFVLGTDTITSIGIRDNSDPTSLGYPRMSTNAEELQLGPVYLNPYSRPKFLIRFDDSLANLVEPAGTFLADGVTKAWSGYELLSQYGFGSKGSTFNLTRRFGTTSYAKHLSVAQMQQLADYGWSHCAQSHQDPIDSLNSGVRLMGPLGFAAKAIASVDTSTNQITAALSHNFISGDLVSPVVFSGTDLPAPLVAGTVYWTNYVTTTAFTLYPTENDAIASTSIIDLTTTGTPANFTYRYGYSANDGSLIQADYQNCVDTLTAMGYGKTAKVYAPNQGAIDIYALAAMKAVGFKYTLGINNQTLATYPQTRLAHMETSGGYYNGVVFNSMYTVPSAIQTDGTPTAEDAEAYIDAVIAVGGVGQNYHHNITSANGPVLAAYLARLRLRASEGACDVVTAEELMDYLDSAKSLTPGVVF